MNEATEKTPTPTQWFVEGSIPSGVCRVLRLRGRQVEYVMNSKGTKSRGFKHDDAQAFAKALNSNDAGAA